MDGGTLAWVDFGMLGWLDEDTWLHQFRLRAAMAQGRVHAAYENLLYSLQPFPPEDLKRFEFQTKSLMRDWLMSSSNPHASIQEKSSGLFLMRVFGQIRKSRAALPGRLMRLYRAIAVADMVMLRLSPSVDWQRVLRAFVEKETRQQFSQAILENLSMEVAASTLTAIIRGPLGAIQLIEWMNTRLPQVGWTFQRQRSIFERAFVVVLSYLQAILFISIAVAIGTRLFGGDQLVESLVVRWPVVTWPVIAGGAAGIFLIGRLVKEIERH